MSPCLKIAQNIYFSFTLSLHFPIMIRSVRIFIIIASLYQLCRGYSAKCIRMDQTGEVDDSRGRVRPR